MNNLEPIFIDNEYRDIIKFHAKFQLLPTTPIPHLLEKDIAKYRFNFMQEELNEVTDAWLRADLVKFIDGLIDLVYVAKGTAILAGFDLELWSRLRWGVHEANMLKERVASAEQSLEQTGRGHAFDVIKPEGWVSPEPLMRALIDHAINCRGRIPTHV